MIKGLESCARAIMVKLQSFIVGKDGNVAMLTGIILVPTILATGIAVDFNRKNNFESDIQEAADAAALVGMLNEDLEQGKMAKKATAVFFGNLPPTIDRKSLLFSATRTTSGTVLVQVTSQLDTMFMKAGGIASLDINVSSEAAGAGMGGAEIVIALDETQSMEGSKWTLAVNALEQTLDSIAAKSGGDGFYVTLLPFNDRVNIGTQNGNFLSSTPPANWSGCVEPREEVNGEFQWYRDDKTPSQAPFDISISGVTGGLAARGNGYPYCASVPITGPTKMPSEISSSLFQFSQIGTGRFEEAMSWAWRLLSPKWKGLWGPADYPAASSDHRRKVAVFISDGRSSAYTYEMDEKNDLGQGVPSSVAMDHFAEICREMKESGIEIFMYQLEGGPPVTPYFKDCASSADHYAFIDDDQDLAEAFKGLDGQKAGSVRIVR